MSFAQSTDEAAVRALYQQLMDGTREAPRPLQLLSPRMEISSRSMEPTSEDTKKSSRFTSDSFKRILREHASSDRSRAFVSWDPTLP